MCRRRKWGENTVCGLLGLLTSDASAADAVDLVEYTVHHEDVRRPNGRGPRPDRDDLQTEVWGKVRQLSGLILRKARIGDVALQLEATGAVAGSHRAGKGDRPDRDAPSRDEVKITRVEPRDGLAEGEDHQR